MFGARGAGRVGAPADDEAVEHEACAARAQQTPGDGQPLEVSSKNGVYFANVSAQGTGCPAGSWNAEVSPDGEVFTLTFSTYELALEPDQSANSRTLA